MNASPEFVIVGSEREAMTARRDSDAGRVDGTTLSEGRQLALRWVVDRDQRLVEEVLTR